MRNSMTFANIKAKHAITWAYLDKVPRIIYILPHIIVTKRKAK